MKIIQEQDNELLNRKEVSVIIGADKNPGIEESIKTISQQFKSEEENIVIKIIKGKFGTNTGDCRRRGDQRIGDRGAYSEQNRQQDNGSDPQTGRSVGA